MRHYEVVFLVHPDQSDQVPGMIERYGALIYDRNDPEVDDNTSRIVAIVPACRDLRRLGSAGVLRQTSVLLMAARTTEADVRLGLELGATDLIRKPFSMTLLLHRATRMLEGL